ncbi:MAG: Uncharacterised protein [Methanobacteriota archaeon]|nr:MAG: Uncharacterised protein [Euryarchaeota archaeon]
MAMNTKLTLYRWMPLILVGIMILSSVSPISENTSELDNEKIIENADARQTPEEELVAECEGITFEDMFVYTHAIFDVTINDDWKSADVWGIGWTNGSEATEVRKDIDELMSQIPGNDASNPLTPNAQGNDGKLSTDERDALEDVGSACVEKTKVRFGLNDILHRGDGEWNNMSWVGDTLLLSDQEINCVLEAGGVNIDHCPITIVEEEDPTYEDGCDNKGDSDCQWVDVSSERNFVLWVHGTTTFDKIDYNSFTLGVNSTNISSADLKVTMPTTNSPIRIGDIESQLDCDSEWDDEGVTYTADCTSVTDNNKQITTRMVNGGNNLQFETSFGYDFSNWPATEHHFFDFTTEEPENNDPPEWTEQAPASGMIPIMVDEEQIIITGEQISSWYYDDYSPAQMDCFDEDGLELNQDDEGNMLWGPGFTGAIACNLVDGSEQVSSTINFEISIALSLSASVTEISGDSVEITVTPNVDSICYVLEPMQGEVIIESESDDDEYCSRISTGTDTITLDGLESLKPGSVMIKIRLFGGDVAVGNHFEIDLGLTIPSTPPIVQITDYNWLDQDGDGIVDTYVLSGQFSDPDGEEVALSITMNGAAAGTIEVNGAEWTSAGIPFYDYDAGDYTIVIQGCDSSGACVSVEKIVPNLYWVEDIIDDVALPEPAPDEAMPAPGIGILLAGIAIALFASRKRQL